MNWKDFFKPTVGKLFLTFVLLMAVGTIVVSCNQPPLIGSGCLRVTGFPLDFSKIVEDNSDRAPGMFYLTQPYKTEVIPLNIVIDIIFWYIIAIFISYLTKKIIVKFHLEKYKKPAIVASGLVMCATPLLITNKHVEINGIVTKVYEYIEFNQFMFQTGFVLFIFSLLNFIHMRLWKKVFYAVLISVAIVIIYGLYIQYKNSGTFLFIN
ncbi:MAG: hypothetical protein WCS88_03700 [Patescibacteria group bacterium]|jgi:hypothetical protein